ncbi:MAG: hypothetical protein ILO10_07325 [Kiritimatiellae bacterium]|nr:hypothetical protein [Kiritimatiellia bacterium]
MEMIRTLGRRLASDRGSVGVVMALIIFVVLGMLTMTWNTAALSKEKMRLQNAADAAALAHAIWQARGMNAVQNINDEMYEALSLAVKLRNVAQVVEPIALMFDAASNAPFVGIIFKGLAIAMHTIGVLTGGTGGWMAARICDKFLKYIAMIYAWGAAPIGYWNAQILASQNGADPLARLSSSGSSSDPDAWIFGIYSLGISWPLTDAFKLPLAPSGKSEMNKAPWKADKISVFESSISPWKQIYSFTGAGAAWSIKPYVSKRGDQEGLKVEDGKVTSDGVLPGPTLWLAFKLGGNIHTLPLDGFWNPDDKGRWTHKLPMFAVAAAQCVTGDVVPHSKKSEEDKTNQRPAGFGAGATAKLVPVSTVFHKMGKVGGYAVDAIIYH